MSSTWALRPTSPLCVARLSLLLVAAGCGVRASQTTTRKFEAWAGSEGGDGGSKPGGGGADDEGGSLVDEEEAGDEGGDTAAVFDEDEGPAGGVGAGCPTLELGWRAPADAGLILGLDVRDADGALLLPWHSVEDAGGSISAALDLCLEPGAVVRMAASADLDGDGAWDTHSCVNDGEGFVTVGRAAAAYAGRVLTLRITPAPTSDGCELSATID